MKHDKATGSTLGYRDCTGGAYLHKVIHNALNRTTKREMNHNIM